MSLLLRITVAVAMAALAGYVYLFGDPLFFTDRGIRPGSIEILRAHAIDAGTPKSAALRYLYEGIDPSDVPNEARLKIRISQPSVDQSVVTIINRYTDSDSVDVTCDRITLRREGNVWLPERHEAAWQGRGHLGWTTSPTL
jgi:hypothetical protein